MISLETALLLLGGMVIVLVAGEALLAYAERERPRPDSPANPPEPAPNHG
jgi:hypothetical protein